MAKGKRVSELFPVATLLLQSVYTGYS